MANHKLFLTHLFLYLCAFVSGGYEFSRLEDRNILILQFLYNDFNFPLI